MTPAGFPHSEIPGSKPVCGSPRLIAACHVLHRRSAPRHPPFTLSNLAIKYLRRESREYRFAILLDSVFKDPASRGTPRLPTEGRLTTEFVFQETVGGADRVRTDDLRLAKPPLSQLSYSPRGLRSAKVRWWAWTDLNCRPHAYQACALTN